MTQEVSDLSTSNRITLVQRIGGFGLLALALVVLYGMFVEPLFRTGPLSYVVLSLFGCCFMAGAVFVLDGPTTKRFPIRLLKAGLIISAFSFLGTVIWWIVTFG